MATVVRLSSHLLDTEVSQWAMEALRLQVLGAMAVDSKLQVPSGTSQLRSKVSEMASEATRASTQPS